MNACRIASFSVIVVSLSAFAQLDSAAVFGEAGMDNAVFGSGNGGGSSGKAEIDAGNSHDLAALLVAGTPAQFGLAPSDTIDVIMVDRPLSIPMGGAIQSATGGSASHVQVAAFKNGGNNACVDTKANKPFDNFGLTGAKASLSAVDPKILVEDPGAFAKDYSSKPIGAFQMSADAYFRTRNAVIALAEQAKYAPLNKAELDKAVIGGVLSGLMAGLPLAPGAGAVAGGIKGGGRAVSEYERDGRRNPGIFDDSEKQMSFPEYNCQYLALLFILLAQNEPSFKVIEPYRMPGEPESDESAGPAGADSVPEAPAQTMRPASEPINVNPVPGNAAAGIARQAQQATAVQAGKNSVSQTPEHVAIEYLKAVCARDYRKLKELYTAEWAEIIDEYAREQAGNGGRQGFSADGMTFAITESKPGVDPGTVNVKVQCKMPGAAKTYNAEVGLQQENGRWRVGLAAIDQDAPFAL